MHRLRLACLALVLAAPGFCPAVRAALPAYQDKTASIETRVADLLPRLTLDEKLSLLGGDRGFYIRAIPRLGLPAIKMSDGPIGLRNDGRSTAYTAGIALAASWDSALARAVGASMGRDARARGVNILLGPAMDIYRVPQNGRNFEYLGEDPFLAAQLAAPVVEGIQSEGVAATAKHYAANNQETDRMGIDENIRKRALREIYLPAFRAAVQTGHAWAVMDAYNRVNGDYCTASSWLNNEVLKKEWGFPGVVMSDWGATHDTLGAANGGLDLEMPSGEFLNAAKLKPLLDSGQISQATLDDKVRRILRLEIALGFLDRPQAEPAIPLDDPHSDAVALREAREGVVLLKNDRALLPLDRARVKSIIVLGPNAADYPSGGGSSRVTPFHYVSVLAGLRAATGAGVDVRYIPGPGADELARLLPATHYDGPLKLEFFTGDGPKAPAVASTEDSRIDRSWHGEAPAPGVAPEHFLARWSGRIVAPADGHCIFLLQNDGGASVSLDGRRLYDIWNNEEHRTLSAVVTLAPGSTHELRVECWHDTGDGFIRFAWGSAPPLLSSADAAAIRAADAVIVCAGFTDYLESEGFDRTYELPGGQPELIRAAAALNPRTIVVLNSGGSVATAGWIDDAAALLQAWYPGQEGGRAIAEILFGDVNPSGRLPISYEKRIEDTPAYGHYPGVNGHVDYAEGILVGYRWYDTKHIAPLFPFGFGLSYTMFSFAHLHVTPAADRDTFNVSFDVTNTGKRAGAEVAQIYVSAPPASVLRPARELKGFQRVTLSPGETQTVTLDLPRRAFAYFDPAAHAWTVAPGNYTVAVGSSSRDLPLNAPIDVK